MAVFSTSIEIKNIVYVKLSIFLTCPTSSWLSAKNYFSLKGLVLNSTEFRFPMQALSFEVWYLRWNPWFKVSKARRFRKMADSIPGHQSFNPNLAYHLFITYQTWISGLIHENWQKNCIITYTLWRLVKYNPGFLRFVPVSSFKKVYNCLWNIYWLNSCKSEITNYQNMDKGPFKYYVSMFLALFWPTHPPCKQT